jgi:hypothetical protein
MSSDMHHVVSAMCIDIAELCCFRQQQQQVADVDVDFWGMADNEQ